MHQRRAPQIDSHECGELTRITSGSGGPTYGPCAAVDAAGPSCHLVTNPEPIEIRHATCTSEGAQSKVHPLVSDMPCALWDESRTRLLPKLPRQIYNSFES